MKSMAEIILKGGKTKLVLICFLLVAIGAGFLLVFANELLAVVLNDYLMVQNFEGLAWRLLLTVGVFVFVYGLNTFSEYLSATFEYSAITRLLRHYYRKLLRAKYGFFLNRPTAEIYTQLWTASQVSGFFFGNILRLMSSIVIFAFYGIVVFRINVLAGIFSIVALPIYFLLTIGLGKKIMKLTDAYIQYISDLSTVTQEGLENITNVKAKGAYGFFESRSVAVLRKIKSVAVKEITIAQYIKNITVPLRVIAPLLVIFAVMGFSSDFVANAGTIMVLYINIPFFLDGFARIHMQYIEYKATKPYLSKLKEFDNASPEEKTGVDITTFESLQVEGVKVTFGDERIVSVPDFEVKKGEKVMFFGESGIGKSTIFNVIMGFQQYDGTVRINGIDLREVSLNSLRSIFGITFQNTNALTLSLHENILLGVEMSSDKLTQLIRLTALGSQQENKGESVLNNKLLSGGEKSRLGLSQMLVGEPSIMLIDEAFSNMDEQLESKIITDLFREYPNRAVVCISHRNSSKAFFDKVVDFNVLTSH